MKFKRPHEHVPGIMFHELYRNATHSILMIPQQL